MNILLLVNASNLLLFVCVYLSVCHSCCIPAKYILYDKQRRMTIVVYSTVLIRLINVSKKNYRYILYTIIFIAPLIKHKRNVKWQRKICIKEGKDKRIQKSI